jgi:uncharacterized protein (DUF1015 family)
MADIKPFCAVRYSPEKFGEKLVAPPYDIINESQRAEMARVEHHMINLDKPGKADDPLRYTKAQERFLRWKKEGVLISDPKASYYVYAQVFKHPETGDVFERTGFFGLVKLEEHYENAIYPHERTLSAPKADRLDLMHATKANLSPVFGLYDDSDNAIGAIFTAIKKEKPLYPVYTDFDGTEHLLWRVSDDVAVTQIGAILKGRNIIIADGHHRYATALTYAKEMRAQNPHAGDEAPYNYVLMDMINFQDAGLVILPTHRLLNLNLPQDDMVKKLEAFFTLDKKTPSEIERALLTKSGDQKQLGYYCGKNKPSYLLTLKNAECLCGVVPESASQDWRKLEVNILYYVILKNIIQISDKDFEEKILYTHASQETFEMIDSGAACCAFLLPSCSKEDLERVTQAREVMPQKSTYFFPKIFSGFVIYDHDVAGK